MRIDHITMAGFGAFKERTEINFSDVADSGLFLITGRTGAGKTTILDAISYALYDAIPSASGKSDKVRSDYCAPTDPTEVTLEFSLRDQRYRITRTPEYERPKTRGTGFTKEKATASFAIWETGEWRVKEATQIRKVAELVEETVQLTAAQFRQVILLAQGQFQEFLLADTTTRMTLLRQLFDTGRFKSYAEELKERRDGLQSRLASSVSEARGVATGLSDRWPADVAGGLPETLSELVEWAAGLSRLGAEQAAHAELEVAAHHSAVASAFTALEQAQQQAELLHRRQRAQAELDQTLVAADQIAQQRCRLDAAQRAAAVSDALTAAETAAQRDAEAEAALRSAEGRLTELDLEPAEEPELLLHDLHARNGAVTAARESERQISRLELRCEALATEAAQIDQSEAVLIEEIGTTDQLLAELAAEAVPLSSAVHRVPLAELSVQTAQAELAAATQHAALMDELGQALQRQVEATKLYVEARGVHSELLTRRLRNYAGALALELTPGEPCQVCGATEHPALASVHGAVSETDLELAAAHEERTRAAATTADQQVAVLQATVKARPADAATITDAALALEQAQHTLQELCGEVERHTALLTHQQATLTHRDELAEQQRALLERRQAHAEARVSAEAAIDELSQQVREIQGSSGSLAELAAQVELEITAYAAVRQARSRADSTRSERERAADVASERLAQSGFDTALDARAASLPPHEVELTKRRVADFDATVAGLNTLLASAEFVGLSELPPADLEALLVLHESAKSAHLNAVHEQSVAQANADATALAATRLAAIYRENAEQQDTYDVLNQLTETVNGTGGTNTRKMKLETFVLAAELEKVLEAANQRLGVMSSHRYQLRHSDAAGRGSSGLDLAVLDAHTGMARHPSSLSGGEKFQASLALALGLADVVTTQSGGLRLETLFIDEGFGSLDAETLDVTMDTLDNLREGGRVLGLISHVESMKDRIGTQLLVERTPHGWSRIRL